MSIFPFSSLKTFLTKENYSKIFVLTDENTQKHCLPILEKNSPQKTIHLNFPAGEAFKNLATAEKIWKELLKNQANRKSLLINLGGGVVTDLGAFVASTFKRGMDFIHVPTTLLAQVDAAIGGKTGVNFQGIKNTIGTFANAKAIFIHSEFLKTLNKRQIKNGMAEIVKHALISDPSIFGLLDNFEKNKNEIIFKAIAVKNKIVLQDFKEKGIRKILNYGHTFGHAIESFCLENYKNPLLHGEAIALGMLLENDLAYRQKILNKKNYDKANTLIKLYLKPKKGDFDFRDLKKYLIQDKKNQDEKINFTLLTKIGKAKFDFAFSLKEIEENLNLKS